MLKAGGEKTYQIGGQTLHLTAMPYGRLKKILAIVAEVFDDLTTDQKQNTAEVMRKMVDVIGKRVTTIFPLLFDPKTHPFINAEWIEDNLTVPAAQEIAEDAMLINGLNDFFKTGGAKKPASPPLETGELVEKEAPITTSASLGSTIFVESPMVGGHAT